MVYSTVSDFFFFFGGFKRRRRQDSNKAKFENPTSPLTHIRVNSCELTPKRQISRQFCSKKTNFIFYLVEKVPLEKPNNLNCFVFLKKQASKIFREKNRPYFEILSIFLFTFIFFAWCFFCWSGADVCLFVLIINLSCQLPEKLELPSHSFVDQVTWNIYNYIVCTHI